MTDAREPSRGGAHAASPHEASHPDGASACGVFRPPRPAPRSGPGGEEAGTAGEEAGPGGALGRRADMRGGEARRGGRRGGHAEGVRRRREGRVEAGSSPKAEGSAGSSWPNSRLSPKWTRLPPPTLNTADTRRASPFLGVTGAAPCHVRNAIIGLTSRTCSIEPFGHLSTPPARASIGCLGITSSLVEPGVRAAGSTLVAACPGDLRGGLSGVRDRAAERSDAHPTEVPTRDVPDITPPNRLTKTAKGCCDLHHIFRACRTTPERPASRRKSEAERPCGHPSDRPVTSRQHRAITSHPVHLPHRTV